MRLPLPRGPITIKPFTLSIPWQGETTEATFWDVNADIGPDRYSEAMNIAVWFALAIPDKFKCVPLEKSDGNLPSKTLAILVGGKVVGAWTAFFINHQRTEGDTVFVTANFSPALPDRGADAYDETTRAILGGIKNKELEIEDGRFVVFEKWGFPAAFPARFQDPFSFKAYQAAVENGEVT
jgi:hypothetical protein